MNDISTIDIKSIMDSLSEGLYVCDLNRRITHWSKSAERITGWSAEDVVGRRCYDNVLCHIDKDGHRLCGEEYCPLHRAMITDSGSKGSLLVFAQGKSGRRIPMQVAVAPIRNDSGQVIGGVETFRDASAMAVDLQRAQAIQQLALSQDVPDDGRVKFNAHYVPHEIVGGDFYAVKKLGPHRYGLMLADVMGHGIAAGLYTMHLSQLWGRYHSLLENPARFTAKVNDELVKVVKTDESFATAVCGLIDLEQLEFRFAGAGGPQTLLAHADGSYEPLESTGMPLAVMEDAFYEETVAEFRPGESLLLFSDGVTEIHNADEEMLDIDGLVGLLKTQGHPDCEVDMRALEESLLKYSNSIRLEDDVTLLEVRFNNT